MIGGGGGGILPSTFVSYRSIPCEKVYVRKISYNIWRVNIFNTHNARDYNTLLQKLQYFS